MDNSATGIRSSQMDTAWKKGECIGFLWILTLMAVPILFHGCAKDPYTLGTAYRTGGDFDRAIASYSEAIREPADDSQLFNALYWRAESYAEQKRFADAYADYDAAKQVACFIADESNSRRYSGNMIPSEFCRKWGDEKMARIAADLSPSQIEEAKRKAAALLPSKYRKPLE